MFEADDRPGGHAHTVSVDLGDETHEVDTGFLVYNERNYPGLVRLFEQLGVATKASDMSFGMTDDISGIEWRGTSFDTVFAQRRNACGRPFCACSRTWSRFNRMARGLLVGEADYGLSLSRSPGVGSVVAPVRRVVPDPHGLLHLVGRPLDVPVHAGGDLRPLLRQPWVADLRGPALVEDGRRGIPPLRRRCPGPAGEFRPPLLSGVQGEADTSDGVEIHSEGGLEQFDHVVLATHSDQALDLLSDPSTLERDVLGAIRYQPNRATLHTDTSLLPRNRRAWASWNYHRLADRADAATLTYRLRSLQGIESSHELLVTLNRDEAIREDQVLARFDYAHPVFDVPAIAAQQRHEDLNGDRRTWFCGAYWGYGFHEDGVQSARTVCRRLAGEQL